MNRAEFSKTLDMNTETVRKYERDFQIDIPRDPLTGHRVYGSKEIEIYLMIKKELKNLSVSELQRKLDLRPQPVIENKLNQEKDNELSKELKKENEFLKNALDSQSKYLEEIKGLTKSIAELSYKTGQYEVQLKFQQDKILQLESNLQEKQQESQEKQKEYSVTAHSFKEKITNLENNIDSYKSNILNKDEILTQKDFLLKEKDSEIERLKRELEKEKSKTIFQRVFRKEA